MIITMARKETVTLINSYIFHCDKIFMKVTVNVWAWWRIP